MLRVVYEFEQLTSGLSLFPAYAPNLAGSKAIYVALESFDGTLDGKAGGLTLALRVELLDSLGKPRRRYGPSTRAQQSQEAPLWPDE
ncbi:hypothetical protein CIC12_23480 [Burkholderia sp. SG-MS1]|nr:hypothetical protein [Paraburkholderia sp. SG-MS1]